MVKIHLTKAISYYPNGHTPVIYGPGPIEVPEETARHFRRIKGLVEDKPPGGLEPSAEPESEQDAANKPKRSRVKKDK